MKRLLKYTIFFSLFLSELLIGCSKKPTQKFNEQDSTILAMAYNRYYRLKSMPDSELIIIAKNSPEPVRSFTKREQFLEFQKHYFDSLQEHLGVHEQDLK